METIDDLTRLDCDSNDSASLTGSYHDELSANSLDSRDTSSSQKDTSVKIITNKWTEDDDERLCQGVQLFGEKNWRIISDFVGTKTNLQCRQRYLKVVAPGIKKGKWSEDEDILLSQVVLSLSESDINWRKISESVPGRTSKQCRERWNHYLSPSVVKTPFSQQEDALLTKLFEIHGKHWSTIAKAMPGRTENQVRFRVDHLKLAPIKREAHSISESEQPTKKSRVTFSSDVPLQKRREQSVLNLKTPLNIDPNIGLNRATDPSALDHFPNLMVPLQVFDTESYDFSNFFNTIDDQLCWHQNQDLDQVDNNLHHFLLSSLFGDE